MWHLADFELVPVMADCANDRLSCGACTIFEIFACADKMQRGFYMMNNHNSSAVTVGDEAAGRDGGPVSGVLRMGGRNGVNSLTNLDGGGARWASTLKLGGGNPSGDLNGPPSQRQSQKMSMKAEDDQDEYGCNVNWRLRPRSGAWQGTMVNMVNILLQHRLKPLGISTTVRTLN